MEKRKIFMGVSSAILLFLGVRSIFEDYFTEPAASIATIEKDSTNNFKEKKSDTVVNNLKFFIKKTSSSLSKNDNTYQRALDSFNNKDYISAYFRFKVLGDTEMVDKSISFYRDYIINLRHSKVLLNAISEIDSRLKTRGSTEEILQNYKELLELKDEFQKELSRNSDVFKSLKIEGAYNYEGKIYFDLKNDLPKQIIFLKVGAIAYDLHNKKVPSDNINLDPFFINRSFNYPLEGKTTYSIDLEATDIYKNSSKVLVEVIQVITKDNEVYYNLNYPDWAENIRKTGL